MTDAAAVARVHAALHAAQRRARAPPLPAAAAGHKSAAAAIARAQAPIDIHEELKALSRAEGESAGCAADHAETSRPCPQDIYGISDQYVVLDSFEMVEGSSRPHEGVFAFNMMVQGVTRDQAIGVKDKLDTIISAHVSEFDVPAPPFDEFDPADIEARDPSLAALGLALSSAGVLAALAGDSVTNPQSQAPYGGRVTMYLSEIGLQSFSDADDRRHHFEFHANAKTDPDRWRLNVKGDSAFTFTEPIQDIHGLTVRFFTPTVPLRFPPSIIYGLSLYVNASGNLEFAFTDAPGLLVLEAGDRIFLRGFAARSSDSSTTPATVTDYGTLNRYINRAAGHLVSPTALTAAAGAHTFTLEPTVGSAYFPVAPTAGAAWPVTVGTHTFELTGRVELRIAKNRVRIPLRLRRIVPRLTNYIAP
jgi:hypothetical protein